MTRSFFKNKIRSKQHAWHQLEKKYIGFHWWYRILTGTKWTYPYLELINGNIKYFQSKIPREFKNGKEFKTIREAKLLNWFYEL